MLSFLLQEFRLIIYECQMIILVNKNKAWAQFSEKQPDTNKLLYICYSFFFRSI